MIMRNDESKYVLVKDIILNRRNNVTTAIITMAKIFMHLWHACLVIKNVLLGILVIVHN